jgi:hypothetical protein
MTFTCQNASSYGNNFLKQQYNSVVITQARNWNQNLAGPCALNVCIHQFRIEQAKFPLARNCRLARVCKSVVSRIISVTCASCNQTTRGMPLKKTLPHTIINVLIVVNKAKVSNRSDLTALTESWRFCLKPRFSTIFPCVFCPENGKTDRRIWIVSSSVSIYRVLRFAPIF